MSGDGSKRKRVSNMTPTADEGAASSLPEICSPELRFSDALDEIFGNYRRPVEARVEGKRRRIKELTGAYFREVQKICSESLKFIANESCKGWDDLKESASNILQNWIADQDQIKENQMRVMKICQEYHPLYNELKKLVEEMAVMEARRQSDMQTFICELTEVKDKFSALCTEQQIKLEEELKSQLIALQKTLLDNINCEALAEVKRDMNLIFGDPKGAVPSVF